MSRRDHSEFFHQSKETATHARNCAYIRDILTLQSEPAGADRRLRAGWSSESADVSVVGVNTQDFREPTIYHVDVHDHNEIENGLGVRKTYYVLAAIPNIRVSKGCEIIQEHDSTQKLFGYLSTNPYLSAPKLNDIGETYFETIAANYAIEAAQDNKDINMEIYLQTFGSKMLIAEAIYKQTHRKVMEQGFEVDGQYFPYTQSWIHVRQELVRIARDARMNQLALPSTEQLPTTDE